MMQKLRQFMELDISSNKNINIFTRARLRLTFYYILIAIIITTLFSFVLYVIMINEIKSHVIENVDEEFFQDEIIENTATGVQTDIILIDISLISLIAILSYFLSGKTLKPIAKSMEAQKRFSAEASHDLRTPLAIMQTDIEVTLSSKSNDINQYKKTLESNLEEVKKMSMLASNLLMIARTEDGPLFTEMVPVEMDHFIEKIILKFKKQTEAKKINVKFISEKTNPVNISPNYFERAIQNIIQNAINYTNNEGEIVITVKQENQNIAIKIEDNGVGIKESDLPYVFDRFYKASHSRNDASGSGLGLPIAKKIIEQHKGNIAIKSKEGFGTLVSINIPK